MESVKEILKKFNPVKDRYVSREFQSFGVHIAEKLDDERHKSLYIKLAKEVPRPVLLKALQFVVDSGARRKGALFMWKLKEMGGLPEKKTRAGRGRKARGGDKASGRVEVQAQD